MLEYLAFFEFVAYALSVIFGLIMLVTAKMVLDSCRRFEISWRSVNAMLLGASGIWSVLHTITGPALNPPDLLLPGCVVIYILGALWRRYGAPARRKLDIPLEEPHGWAHVPKG